LTISNSRVPPVWPLSRRRLLSLRKARPIGDGSDQAFRRRRPRHDELKDQLVAFDDMDRGAEAGAILGNPVDVEERDLQTRLELIRARPAAAAFRAIPAPRRSPSSRAR
jgi:hypothetical protein